MTGFPIAIGTGPRRSSSRTYPNFDGSNLQPDGGDDVIMTMGNNDDDSLTATVFIKFRYLPSGNAYTEDGAAVTDNELPENSGEQNFKNVSSYQPSSTERINQSITYNVIAELRVQIDYSTAPFSSNTDTMSSRETKCKVPLGRMRRKTVTTHNEISTKQLRYQAGASVIFSSNESHLVCLIPFPREYEPVSPTVFPSNEGQSHTPTTSVVVIFSIQSTSIPILHEMRRQRKNLPPLPDYIIEKTVGENSDSFGNNRTINVDGNYHHGEELTNKPSDEENMTTSTTTANIEADVRQPRRHFKSYVAHQPRIVRLNIQTSAESYNETIQNNSKLYQQKHSKDKQYNSTISPPLQTATSICDIPTDRHCGKSSCGLSSLLIGTVCGSLLLVDFATARVYSTVLKLSDIDDGYISPIVHLSQCPPTVWKSLDKYGEEQGSQSNGRVALVTRDGSTIVFATSFVILPTDSMSSSFHRSLSVGSDTDYSRSTNINGRTEKRHNQSLEIRLERITTFGHAGMFEPNLRYVRAKWLNSLFLVLLTRSPNLDQNILTKMKDAVNVLPEVVIAQVWRIDNHTLCTGTVVEDKCAFLVSELKRPIRDEDLMKEGAHSTFTTQNQLPSIDECTSGGADFTEEQLAVFVANCESSMSLSYHRNIDCLTVCTQSVITVRSSSRRQFKVFPICMVWDWKRNVSGLTLVCSTPFNVQLWRRAALMPSFFSRFHITECSSNGLSAMHTYEKRTVYGKKTIIKDSFKLGVLSPYPGRTSCSIQKPSAMLLSPEYVLYPYLSTSTTTSDVLIQWEESNVPQNYLLNNGHCRLATISDDRLFIAVAADRGLCILDLSQRSYMKDSRQSHSHGSYWKLFSRVNEEQSFRVLHMVWWDRNENNPQSERLNARSDHFLIAVIQYAHSDVLYLAGWSCKRRVVSYHILGFGNDQILFNGSTPLNDHNKESNNYGIPLPGLRSHSLSIITDPAGSKQRALILVTFEIPVSGGDSAIKYVIYQLQSYKTPQKKSEMILSRLFSSGMTNLTIETTLGIFLAGGSFSFQLNSEPLYCGHNIERTVIIGAITMTQGLIAACIHETESPSYRCLLDDPKTNSLIVSYQEADSFSDECGSRIAWTIVKNDGGVYLWVVHCSSIKSRKNRKVAHFSHTEIDLSLHSDIGDICYLGSSSLWMNGASTNENEIAIGNCSKKFPCNLFAGQHSRTVTVANQSISSLHISNFIVGPLSFTPVLYITFLILMIKEDGDLTKSSNEFLRRYIRTRLSQIERSSALSSIRIIVFKVIELLSDAKCKDVGTKWLAGKFILQEVVNAIRDVFDILESTRFWLSVGRQLEPHQFNLIFPLPKCRDETGMSTAEELFSVSCAHGSLSIALSALPLFSSHIQSQKRVVQLVYHCLEEIKQDLGLSLFSVEEINFVHQLFWFGVKLEDAIERLNISKDSEFSSDETVNSAFTEPFEESSGLSSSSDNEDDFSVDTSPDILLSPSRQTSRKEPTKKGLITKVVTNLFSSKHQLREDVDEDAIHDAASSFIVSGFDSPSKARLPTPLPVRHDIARSMSARDQESTKRNLSFNDTNDNEDPFQYSDVTVAGAVSAFICDTIGLHQDMSHSQMVNTNVKSGWKTVSVVAHLLQGDRETSAITFTASPNAQMISRESTINVADANSNDDCANEIIVQFFRRLIGECATQIQPEGAGVIFNLILLLLLRYDTCEDVHAFKTTLIIVGIVSGHNSGRISELIDLSCSNRMRDIYCTLLKSLSN